MDDRAILIVQEYMNEHLREPDIMWPKEEFELHVYQRLAANEILSRLIFETEKLPEHISGLEQRSPIDIIEEFISEIDYYSSISRNTKTQLLFLVTRDEAKSILDLFL